MLTRFLARRRAIAFLQRSAPIGGTYCAERAALVRLFYGDAIGRRLLAFAL